MGFLALAGGTVHPMTGQAATVGGTLLIRDGVIHGSYPSLAQARAGAAGAAGAPVEVVDVTGRSVLPGLLDCHVHLFFDGGPDLTAGPPPGPAAAAAHAAAYLRAGVTTVRDLGAPLPGILALRDAIAAGTTAGPRVLAAGPILTVPGGHGTFAGEVVAEPDRLPEAVDRLADHGVDCVKIAVSGGVSTPGSDLFAVQFPEPTLRAGVAAAHRRGLPVAAHASNPAAVRIAARAGVDSIEHAVMLDDAAVAALAGAGAAATGPAGGSVAGGSVAEPTLAGGGPVLVPTLVATSQPPEVLADPRLPAQVRQKGRVTVAAHRTSIRRAAAAGVPMAGGTDGGSTLTGHALTAREAGQLVGCGLSPARAIAALTRDAAALLGLAGQVGTLAPGTLADVLVVAGDPYQDITSLAEVKLVVQGGTIVRYAS